MLLITDFKDIPSLSQPCGLTIGTFDGVHLGHQTLIKHIKSKLPVHGLVSVFTFLNHPSHLLTPKQPTPLIFSPLQKVKYLADYGADIVFLIPFTPEFAKIPFKDFLGHLKKRLNFSHLVLGIGATFGKNREGDEPNVRKLSDSLAFTLDYLPKTMIDNMPISSGRIRSLITQGAFHQVQACLGHPYALMGRLHERNALFYLPLPGICLPLEGIYPVRVKVGPKIYLAKAHLFPREEMIRLDPLKTTTSLHHKDIELLF